MDWGSDHVAHPMRTTIINPARLDCVAANDICIRPAGGGQNRPLL
jgi:hypothetical protein